MIIELGNFEISREAVRPSDEFIDNIDIYLEIEDKPGGQITVIVCGNIWRLIDPDYEGQTRELRLINYFRIKSVSPFLRWVVDSTETDALLIFEVSNWNQIEKEVKRLVGEALK